MDKSYYDADFEEVLKDSDTKGIYKKAGNYPAVNKDVPATKNLTETNSFLKRRMKLSGLTGAVIGAGALAIDKLKSMAGKDIENKSSEKGIDKLKSIVGIENKSEGGMVRFKKRYQMHKGKF